MNHVTHPLTSADISIFSQEISKFCYIKKYRYRLHFDAQFLTLLTFLEPLKIVLINMVRILMMSAQMVTPGHLKRKKFWNKGYDVKISVHDVTTTFYSVIQTKLQMWSCDQNLVTLVFLWETLSLPQFYKDLTRKTAFFEVWYWFKFNNFGLALGIAFKFYTSVERGLKLKVRKFCGLIPKFVEITGEKLVERPFCSPLLILNRVKT